MLSSRFLHVDASACCAVSSSQEVVLMCKAGLGVLHARALHLAGHMTGLLVIQVQTAIAIMFRQFRYILFFFLF